MSSYLLVFEHGDLTAFRTVEDAERYLEPEDVARNEYAVFDATGRVFSLRGASTVVARLWGLWKVSHRSVKIEGGASSAPDELRERLTKYLVRSGSAASAAALQTVSLDKLADQAIKIAGFSK